MSQPAIWRRSRQLLQVVKQRHRRGRKSAPVHLNDGAGRQWPVCTRMWASHRIRVGTKCMHNKIIRTRRNPLISAHQQRSQDSFEEGGTLTSRGRKGAALWNMRVQAKFKEFYKPNSFSNVVAPLLSPLMRVWLLQNYHVICKRVWNTSCCLDFTKYIWECKRSLRALSLGTNMWPMTLARNERTR